MSVRKLMNPSAERNKAPILEILKNYFRTDKPGNVLEISSGTGQHVAFFAPNFPNLTFQPSEYDKSMLPHIKLHSKDSQINNIKDPLHIDVTTPHDTWDLETKKFDYMININMIHISPFACTDNLFKNAGILLEYDGLLITYGPYAMNGILEPESNIKFDKMLRCQNTTWGIRDIDELKILAEKSGLHLINIHDMPANNKCLIWKKVRSIFTKSSYSSLVKN